MSGALEIYTYGGGEALTQLFNGIAAAVGDDNYTTLIRVAALTGMAYVLITVAFQPSFSKVGKWFVSFMVIYNAILLPKVDLVIVDKLNPSSNGTVIANVPWGLGYFAHMTSSIGDGITELAERNFSLPEDLKYHKHGTVMASSLVARTSEFQITNPDMAANIREYMQQCVFYDVLLGKYTLRELFEASNIWEHIRQTASPARSFRYQQNILTCAEGVGALEQDWQQEIQDATKVYGQRFFSDHQPDEAKAVLLSVLPISYQYLTSVSESASDLIRQNMLINAVKQGLIANGATSDASAAIQNFAVSRAEQQQRTAYAITGQLAARWLPIMKNVFEALFYGAFLFIFLLTLLPSGVMILKTYLMSLFWVQSWAPLYAVLNLLMNLDAKGDSIAAAAQTGGYALSLATASGIQQVNSDTAVLAGYLSMSIPFIAYGIIKGGAYTFTHLAGYIGGVSQASATQASEEATTGNINLGNTSMSNHTMNNTSAHKHDMNADVRMGASTYQTESGANVTTTSSGLQSISTGSAISNLGTQVRLSESYRSSASQQSEHYTQQAEHQAQEAAQSLSQAYRQTYELASHQAQQSSNGENAHMSESSQTNRELYESKQLVDSFAKTNGVTSEQATTLLAAASVKTKMPGLAQFFSPIDFEANGEMQGLNSAKSNELFSNAEDFVRTHNFAERMDYGSRTAVDQYQNSSDEQGQRLANQLATSLDEANTHRDSTTHSLQKAEAFRQLSTYSEDQAASIDKNANQEFIGWVKNQLNEEGQNISIHEAERILHQTPAKASVLAQGFITEKTNEFIEQGIGNQLSGDLPHSSSPDFLMQRFSSQSDNILNQAQQEGINTQQAPATASDAREMLDNAKSQMEAGQAENQTHAADRVARNQTAQEEGNILPDNVMKQTWQSAKRYAKELVD